MPAVSRLEEFRERVAQAGGGGGGMHDPLLPQTQQSPTSHFFKLSREIGADIKRTTRELDELAKVAAKKTLFDDPTVQIQERTAAIKRTIGELNTKIKTLQSLQSKQQGSQADKHNDSVVTLLKTKLAVTGQGLQTVLKSRNKVMLAQKERLEALHAQPAASSAPAKASSLFGSDGKRTLFGGRNRFQDDAQGGDDGLDGAIAIDMTGSGQMQAMSTVMQSGSTYYQDRAAAVENLEGAIEDVAEMFAEFAVVLEQQREMVLRIDENVDAALVDVELGQSELVKYYKSISSNRGLMFKIFLVLAVFAVFFIVFLT